MTHKAGYVTIIGYPNAGKSTLMNAMVGERLSIITHKIQTTRHRIKGILSGDDFQVVYSDTPGLLKPHYLLHRAMIGEIMASLADADVILLITEVNAPFDQPEITEYIEKNNLPLVILINKIDLSSEEVVKNAVTNWQERFPKSEVIPVSALHYFNLGKVLDTILMKLPESPPSYPKDELTDRSERFFVAEIIREKILLLYEQEIPYSCEVAVDSFKEKGNIVHIIANIYVSRESQKAILLGHGGRAIKRLGTTARKDIEDFLEQRIFLELVVKVEKDWRENSRMLKRFGYQLE